MGLLWRPIGVGVKKFEEASRVIDFHTGHTHFWKLHRTFPVLASVEDQAGQMLAESIGRDFYGAERKCRAPPKFYPLSFRQRHTVYKLPSL